MGSEDVKNWVSALSIVVGGLWVLYQWNTLFPKTEAEVAVSAASLRTRTGGDVTVTLIPPPEGDYPATPDGRYFHEVCGDGGAASVRVRLPVRVALTLTSSAPIPIRVEVTEFLLAEVVDPPAALVAGPAPAFVADALGPVEAVALSDAAFVGGLRWTHVEPGGSSAVAVLGSVNLPFSCSFGGSSATPAEFAFGLKTELRAVGRDGSLGEAAERYFYRLCRVNPDGGSSCAMAEAEAGDGDGDGDGAGAADGAGFKVIAQ